MMLAHGLPLPTTVELAAAAAVRRKEVTRLW